VIVVVAIAASILRWHHEDTIIVREPTPTVEQKLRDVLDGRAKLRVLRGGKR
jgi:hypothetical protein